MKAKYIILATINFMISFFAYFIISAEEVIPEIVFLIITSISFVILYLILEKEHDANN
jgi:hypothetical protein